MYLLCGRNVLLNFWWTTEYFFISGFNWSGFFQPSPTTFGLLFLLSRLIDWSLKSVSWFRNATQQFSAPTDTFQTTLLLACPPSSSPIRLGLGWREKFEVQKVQITVWYKNNHSLWLRTGASLPFLLALNWPHVYSTRRNPFSLEETPLPLSLAMTWGGIE